VGSNGLHATCTYGAFLHLHPICGTRRSIRPVGPDDLRVSVPVEPFFISIRPVGSDGLLVLVDPSPSDLWDPTTPFSISIRYVGLDGPSDLWDLMTYVSVYLWSLSLSPSDL
jgi:hypothetical protein